MESVKEAEKVLDFDLHGLSNRTRTSEFTKS